MFRRLWAFLFLFVGLCAFGQANGKLQIHFMDAGQADAAVLISPRGEIVLFDNGVAGQCDKPISYLQQLGVTKIDYNVLSHYHADHMGCTKKLLAEFPLQKNAYDRGGSPKAASYLQAVGTHRKTAGAGTSITLDADTESPVEINFVALNGNGIRTSNENDLSVVAIIRFGKFDAEIGGDLSGFNNSSYDDIETSVAPKVGRIEVYKVHHHCSQYSTNDAWLAATQPKVAIISAGDGNRYLHPKQQCLDRLHAAGVRTYWTEDGNGGTPVTGKDVVGKNIVVEVAPNAGCFTVTYAGAFTDTYSLRGEETPADVGMPKFAWSKAAKVYHEANCNYVDNISPANLERGDTPPADKTSHKCVKGGSDGH